MEEQTVHLIGNAHLDPVWLWRWQEGCAEVLATFRSALDRMEEFPDYIFTCAGAAYYAWVEELDPAMFARIVQRVQEGRWVIVGGWWIQPDCNAPCGESFARHALYSQRYFLKHFGRRARVGYNVDSFGHSAMLPQILRQSGLDAYVYMRPNDTLEKQYPFPDHAFLWESPDGTSLPAFRIPTAYCTDPFDGAAQRAEALHAIAQQEGRPLMCFYGVGNHGGGPTIRNLKALTPLVAGGGYRYSSPDAYFDALDPADLPILRDELQHHASGCYTAVMGIKERNRRAECRLLDAERLQALACQAGVLDAPVSLEAAWKDVLFQQFHDIMGGCAVRGAYDDAYEALGGSLSAAAREANRACQRIAWSIDTTQGRPIANEKLDFRLWEQEGRGVPLVVFNPHGFPAQALVRTAVKVAAARNDAGNPVPVQSLRSPVTNGRDDKWETAILAQVPPMGWRLYWLYQQPPEPAVQGAGTLLAGENFLENDFLRVEFDAAACAITRFYDKKSGRELLRAGARARVMDETPCDTWAHNIFSFREEIGAFSQAHARVTEEGALCASLRLRGSYGASQLELTATLFRDRPGLSLRYRVNWQEKHAMLKLCFPTACADGRPVSSIPYGFLERPADGKDYPMQKWVAWQEAAGFGLGVATDTRTAYDAWEGELRITALRSPIFADHYGARDDACEFTDQGEHTFSLTLLPLDGDRTPLLQEGELLAAPLTSLVGTYHEGTLSPVGSALSVDVTNILPTVLKPAEDGEGWILRCHETQGLAVEATLRLPLLGVSWRAGFAPQQIRSFRIHQGRVTPVNLLEEPLAEAGIPCAEQKAPL